MRLSTPGNGATGWKTQLAQRRSRSRLVFSPLVVRLLDEHLLSLFPDWLE